MASNILTVADVIATRITSGLDGGDTTTVSRVYNAPTNIDTVSGRKVYVFPVGYSNSPANRAEDSQVYVIHVTILERYTTAGDPTNAWLDARVDFVSEHVVERCDFVRELLTFETTRRLYTISSEVTVYDIDYLTTNKLFLSDVRFEFGEYR